MDNFSRRDVLAAGAATSAALLLPNGVFAQGKEKMKIGLIGSGGRGTDAVMNAFAADPAITLWAIGDVFPERVTGSLNSLKERQPTRVDVGDRHFSGFDAYKHVIGSGVDYVILTTPPAFRPVHFKAAIEAGHHVFMEKPVAVDAAGIRSVIESGELAKTKKLSVVTGTQRRHELPYLEAMKRIHDGQIGDVVACYAYWNQGSLWMHPREAAWSDMEWQLKNWLYFTWLSGDHIVEQHLHNLDVCNWAMNGHPVKAVSLGGRQVRTDPAYGHIFDHFATEYEYANGVKMLSMCRQIDGTDSRVSEHIVGSKGTSNACTNIKGEKPWRWEGDSPNPYMLEHRDLIKSIRDGAAVNEAKRVAESTMTAILGRMAAYSGKEVSWDAAMASQISLVPEHLSMDASLTVPAVAVPGKTQAV
ncbi:MAG: Gfo/Idh/MocA family oxidoreductase [Fimbriimonadaceae bacterium]